MKYITAIGIVILTVVVWVSTADKLMHGASHYQENMAAAAAYEERGLYLKAVSSYFAAHEEASEQQKYDIELKVIRCYEQLGDREGVEKYCRQVIHLFPEKQECYQKLISFYQDTENYEILVPLLEKAMKQFPKEELYQKQYEDVEKNYVVYQLGYTEMSDWLDDYLLVKTETQTEDGFQMEHLILNSAASEVADELYYDRMSMTDDVLSRFIVEDEKGRWKIVNPKGYEMENNLNVSFSAVGVQREGYAWAVIDDKYHMINQTMAVSKTEYDWIGTVENGYTAVRQGKLWALFDAVGQKNETKYQFKDIKVDEFQRCYVNERFFADQGNGYQIYNQKGEAVSQERFEDARPFVGVQPAAVKKEGKWGFVNKSGEFYIEPVYEDAKSFSHGYAAVKVDGKWGFINRDGVIVVEAQFQDAKSFGSGGAAPVQDENGYWNLIWMNTIRYS